MTRSGSSEALRSGTLDELLGHPDRPAQPAEGLVAGDLHAPGDRGLGRGAGPAVAPRPHHRVLDDILGIDRVPEDPSGFAGATAPYCLPVPRSFVQDSPSGSRDRKKF